MQRKIRFIVTVFLRSGETVRIGCYDTEETAACVTEFSSEYPGRKIRVTLSNGGRI